MWIKQTKKTSLLLLSFFANCNFFVLVRWTHHSSSAMNTLFNESIRKIGNLSNGNFFILYLCSSLLVSFHFFRTQRIKIACKPSNHVHTYGRKKWIKKKKKTALPIKMLQHNLLSVWNLLVACKLLHENTDINWLKLCEWVMVVWESWLRSLSIFYLFQTIFLTTCRRLLVFCHQEKISDDPVCFKTCVVANKTKKISIWDCTIS